MEKESTKINDIVVDQIIDLFEKKNFKKKLIKRLNDSVDIPFINEKTEKTVLNKIYDLLIDSLKDLVDEK
tara:strand:+ start:517 stop:726 length:210 start_codon:yes stop_codon:yes gene_type:complete